MGNSITAGVKSRHMYLPWLACHLPIHYCHCRPPYLNLFHTTSLWSIDIRYIFCLTQKSHCSLSSSVTIVFPLWKFHKLLEGLPTPLKQLSASQFQLFSKTGTLFQFSPPDPKKGAACHQDPWSLPLGLQTLSALYIPCQYLKASSLTWVQQFFMFCSTFGILYS